MTNIQINLEKDFLSTYERITSIKPVPGRLAVAKDGNYYWLYYAGLGQTGYHELPDMEQKIVRLLLKKKELNITDDTYAIPIFGEDSLIGEAIFKIISK